MMKMELISTALLLINQMACCLFLLDIFHLFAWMWINVCVSYKSSKADNENRSNNDWFIHVFPHSRMSTWYCYNTDWNRNKAASDQHFF